MKIELEIWEIYDILSEGTTNQRQFIKECDKYNCYEEAIHVLNLLQSFDTLRGLLNSGAITINNEMKETDDMVFEVGNGAFLHFAYRNYCG